MKKKMPGWEMSDKLSTRDLAARFGSAGESVALSLTPAVVGTAASLATGNPAIGAAAGAASMVPLFYLDYCKTKTA